LIAEADRAGVTLGVVFQDRMKPGVRALKASIEAGEFGPLSLVQAQVPWWRPPEYYRESRWRGTWALDGGGALMNQAIHTVDLMLWLCGPVTRVYGKTATRLHDIEVEDTAVAVLEFASGAVGTLLATTCAYPGGARRIEITGSKGSAVFEDPPRPAVVAGVTAHRRVVLDFIHALRPRLPPVSGGR